MILVLFATSCGGPGVENGEPGAASVAGSDEPEAPFEVVIEGFQPLISDATTELALPADLEVDGDGNLWIVDRRLGQLLVAAPDGELLRTIGRNGQGPGEFRIPSSVAVRGERVFVRDNFHGVQIFDMAGDYLSARPSAARVLDPVDFSGDGGLVVSSYRVATDGALALVEGPDGEEVARIGELPFPNAEEWGLMVLREEILRGTIPAALRNTALPVLAPDGSLWVLLQTESTLRHYGADGALLGEARFDLPEMEAMKEQYFEDFRSLPGADAFFFPSMADDGIVAGDSLLLLWGTVADAPGLITLHDSSGALVQRWVLGGLGGLGGGRGGRVDLRLALDVPRRRLYVSVSDIATVFAVDLPDAARF